MRSLFLLFGLLLVLPAAAQSPAAVVREVYSAHSRNHDQKKTLREHSHCFTPGFLSIARRALAKPSGTSAWVDWDFLFNTQDGGIEFEMGQTRVAGSDATVALSVYQRGDYRQSRPDPNWRSKTVRNSALTLLTNVGHGFQIYDIRFLPDRRRSTDGTVSQIPGHSVRQELLGIANSK